ncbi:MAG: hypothetical protein CL913_00405 [Deltaproteobacteria bacterium]|nr:hypothetical protein [Deltaproteobacteria bacterium]
MLDSVSDVSALHLSLKLKLNDAVSVHFFFLFLSCCTCTGCADEACHCSASLSHSFFTEETHQNNLGQSVTDLICLTFGFRWLLQPLLQIILDLLWQGS